MIPMVAAIDGAALPAIGFGTAWLNGRAGSEAIGNAIAAGFRLIDSAFNYENEGAVGRAVRASDVPREDLVVTSKLPGGRQSFDAAIATVQESVYRTGLDYLDLYLIHWPNPRIGLYVEAWQALIEAREQGLVRMIGVCNFLPEHLERLEARTGVRPAVNQIELHPLFPQTEALAYHREHGIVTESWSPLGRGSDLLANLVITRIAEAHEASPAQVVLAWHAACGAIPLPRSSSQQHLRDNLASFDVRLSDDEVAQITALGRSDGRIADQDPAVYEEL